MTEIGKSALKEEQLRKRVKTLGIERQKKKFLVLCRSPSASGRGYPTQRNGGGRLLRLADSRLQGKLALRAAMTNMALA